MSLVLLLLLNVSFVIADDEIVEPLKTYSLERINLKAESGLEIDTMSFNSVVNGVATQTEVKGKISGQHKQFITEIKFEQTPSNIKSVIEDYLRANYCNKDISTYEFIQFHARQPYRIAVDADLSLPKKFVTAMYYLEHKDKNYRDVILTDKIYCN